MTPFLPIIVSWAAALLSDSLSGSTSVPEHDPSRPPPDAALQPREFPEGADLAMRSAWWLAYFSASRKIGEMLEAYLGKRAAESLPKWRMFWKLAVQRLGLRGTLAAGLVAMDGPLPVGDALALGLTVWMIYDLYVLADEIWDLVDELVAEGQLENF